GSSCSTPTRAASAGRSTWRCRTRATSTAPTSPRWSEWSARRSRTRSTVSTPRWPKIAGSLRRLAVWLRLLATWEGALRFVGRRLVRLVGPMFLGLQTLPSVCWVPLAVLTLGLNERGILFVIVAGSVFAIAIALRDGLKTIPPLYQRAGLMMGARGWKLYRYVLLPASLPAMTSSLRQGFAFAWRSLLGAELILAARYHGLGFLLETGRSMSEV